MASSSSAAEQEDEGTPTEADEEKYPSREAMAGGWAGGEVGLQQFVQVGTLKDGVFCSASSLRVKIATRILLPADTAWSLPGMLAWMCLLSVAASAFGPVTSQQHKAIKKIPLAMQEAKEEQQGAPKAGAKAPAKKAAKPSKAATTSPKQVADEPGKYPSKESIGPFCKFHSL